MEPQRIDLLIGAVKAASGGTSNLTIALISAGAAILGAVVGGSLTAYATYRIEQSRQTHDFELEDRRHAHEDALEAQASEREVEREHRALLGTARMLTDHLSGVQSVLRVSLDNEVWWPKIVAYDRPPVDIERVLGLLTNDEWITLSNTMGFIEGLALQRQIVVANSDAQEPEPQFALDDDDKESFRDGIERIERAQQALLRVAAPARQP